MKNFGGTFGKGKFDDQVPTRQNNDDLDDDDFRVQRSGRSGEETLMKTRGFNYKEQAFDQRNRSDMKKAFEGLSGDKNKNSPTRIKRGISDIVETMDDRTKENMFQTFKSSHGGPGGFGVSMIQMPQG